MLSSFYASALLHSSVFVISTFCLSASLCVCANVFVCFCFHLLSWMPFFLHQSFLPMLDLFPQRCAPLHSFSSPLPLISDFKSKLSCALPPMHWFLQLSTAGSELVLLPQAELTPSETAGPCHPLVCTAREALRPLACLVFCSSLRVWPSNLKNNRSPSLFYYGCLLSSFSLYPQFLITTYCSRFMIFCVFFHPLKLRA